MRQTLGVSLHETKICTLVRYYIKWQHFVLYCIFTSYNRIEHSTRIRHTRDGQREGFLIILLVCYIWNAVLTYIQMFEDIFK